LLTELDSLLGVSQDFIFHLQALDEKAIMDNCPRLVAVLFECLDDSTYNLAFLVLCQKRQRRSQRVVFTFSLSKLHEALIRIDRQESRRVVLELLVKLKKEICRNPIDVVFLVVAGLEPERAGRSTIHHTKKHGLSQVSFERRRETPMMLFDDPVLFVAVK
jgi:hypothetical protein